MTATPASPEDSLTPTATTVAPSGGPPDGHGGEHGSGGPDAMEGDHMPPWMQPPPEAQTAWWEDNYALALTSGIALLGTLLAGLGFIGARWLA